MCGGEEMSVQSREHLKSWDWGVGKGRVVCLVLSRGKSHRNQHPHNSSIFSFSSFPCVLWKYIKVAYSITISLLFPKFTHNQPATLAKNHCKQYKLT